MRMMNIKSSENMQLMQILLVQEVQGAELYTSLRFIQQSINKTAVNKSQIFKPRFLCVGNDQREFAAVQKKLIVFFWVKRH